MLLARAESSKYLWVRLFNLQQAAKSFENGVVVVVI